METGQARSEGKRKGAAGHSGAGVRLRSAGPEQIAVFARRSAQALAGLGLLSLVAGGGVLVMDALGLTSGGTPDALWLIACGLIAAALSAVAAGLARVARGIGPTLSLNDLALVSLHGRSGDIVAVDHADPARAALAAGLRSGASLFERILVADRPAFLAALSAASAGGGEGCCEVRLRGEDEDGAPVYAWMQMRAVPAAQGLTRASWRDITATKLKAEREAQARAEAEQANHAKSRFLATMSHELRTPLNTILGFSELLTTEAGGQMDAARRSEYARIIHDSGQHLLGLVNDILDLSRVEAGAYDLSREPLDVGMVVGGCREMMALEASRRAIDLRVRVAPRLPVLRADHRALRQILLNLLSNAVKFTPENGRVDLSVRQRGAQLVFVVRDTGPGMNASDVAQLGEPFFQAGDMEHKRHGSGLGLAVVRALVLLHDGTFHVASTLGRGTTVTVSLPMAQDSSVVAFTKAEDTISVEPRRTRGRRSA